MTKTAVVGLPVDSQFYPQMLLALWVSFLLRFTIRLNSHVVSCWRIYEQQRPCDEKSINKRANGHLCRLTASFEKQKLRRLKCSYRCRSPFYVLYKTTCSQVMHRPDVIFSLYGPIIPLSHGLVFLV